eukprot:gene8036-8231_t
MSLMLVALAAAARTHDEHGLVDPAAQARSSAASILLDEQVPLTYDPEALSSYFRKRPMQVFKRNAVVLSKLGAFLSSVAADWQMGKWDENMPMRAKQCVAMLECLGPAFVKIGQATSTRVDVLPEPYVKELQKLQDKVAVFSSIEARQMIEEELGRPIGEVFEWLSDEPVASASLGQVYHGKLLPQLGGKEVAVKVQRPGVLEGAALDIYVMRRALQIYCKLPGVDPQWSTVLDEWALRFFGEMDYQQEARNTAVFKRQMAHLEGVMVAEIYPQLTTRKILVMQWLSGQRLADVDAADVRPLCGTLLNCFLIQLLETGLLHSNLMRSAEGKLVILDFGLVTEVSEDQRIALVEFITHLTTEDWPAIVTDMISLGFLPHGLPAGQTVEDLAPLMQKVLGQLIRGGGIGGIDAFALHCDMDHIAKEYKLFLPPYFTLVLRAFSTIEGIALKASPSYSILSECMPYLSRRLLTDNDPRMRAALKHLLYGNRKRLDLERLVKMITAFGSFSTAATPSQQSTARAVPSKVLQRQQQRQITRYQQGSFLGGRGSAGLPDPFAVASAVFTLPAAMLGSVFASGNPSLPVPSAARMMPGNPLWMSGGSSSSEYNSGSMSLAAVGLLTEPEPEPVVSDSMKEVLKIVFSPKGSFVQELLVDELAAGVDAMSREALFEAFNITSSAVQTLSGMRSSQALGPLTSVLLPPLPLLNTAHQVMAALRPPVMLSEEDEMTLNNIRMLVSLVQGAALSSLNSYSTAAAIDGMSSSRVPNLYMRAATELAPMVPTLLPGIQNTVEMFVRQLARRIALRVAADLDPAGAAAVGF